MEPSKLSAIRANPLLFKSAIALRVRRGVALGVIEVRTPCPVAYSMRSKMSGRFIGSPPVRTNTGTPMEATWSISPWASWVESSKGCRRGSAQARQCTQARSQACVVSQITIKGFSLRFIAAILRGRQVQSSRLQEGRLCLYEVDEKG